MSLALTLIIAGLLLGFGAFVFAAINMFRSVTREGSFSGFFKGHIGAMIAMAFGGLLFLIGIIIAVGIVIGAQPFFL